MNSLIKKGPFGCVLVKDCGENTHRDFELRLFNNPNGVSNNDNDWPIRFILSSYYHTYGPNGIPGLIKKKQKIS